MLIKECHMLDGIDATYAMICSNQLSTMKNGTRIIVYLNAVLIVGQNLKMEWKKLIPINRKIQNKNAYSD